jgi:RNA polymerase sigma-70 factor, ECF subfamily
MAPSHITSTVSLYYKVEALMQHPLKLKPEDRGMSDAELVRLACTGRTEAYAELVHRWAPRVTALCHARLGRAHAADDLAQETLLRGFRSLASLTDAERFGPWLCGIAVRTCLDWLKSKQNQQIPFSAFGADSQPGECQDGRQDHSDAERDDERRHLLAAVEALPEDYRQVVMLYYYEDVTYRDLGRILGVSPATINARLTKARALLRARLTDCRR